MPELKKQLIRIFDEKKGELIETALGQILFGLL